MRQANDSNSRRYTKISSDVASGRKGREDHRKALAERELYMSI